MWEAENFNNLLEQHLSAFVQSWTCDESGWIFNIPDASIQVVNDPGQPLSVIIASENIPRKQLDKMRMELRRILKQSLESEWGPIAFAVTLLQLTEEAESLYCPRRTPFKQSRKTSSFKALSEDIEARRSMHGGWRSANVQGWTCVQDLAQGVNLLTLHDPARHILTEPVAKICSRLSQDLRILHVEPVYRDDLVCRFFEEKGRIYEQLLSAPYEVLRQAVSVEKIPRGSSDDNHLGLANELCQPKTTFHGARRRVIKSIVRYGFIVPGAMIGDSDQTLNVQRGASFWNGDIF